MCKLITILMEGHVYPTPSKRDLCTLCLCSGERDDPNELGRLLQLILGCAVNCDSKQEYIERIMAMEESVQHGVMKAIQEVSRSPLV